jgi:two-component system NtrC family sensor kinase
MSLQPQGILFELLTQICPENIEVAALQEDFVEKLCQAFQAEGGAFLLIRPDGLEQTLKVSRTAKPTWSIASQSNWQAHPLAKHLLSQKSGFVAPNSEIPHWFQSEAFSLTSLYIQPLAWEDELLGAIALFNLSQERFSEEDQKSFAQFAALLSKAIAQQRQLNQLKIQNANLEVNQWQLLRSRNTLRALFDNIPVSMYIIDKKYNLIAVNMDRAKRINSLPNELVGRRCYEALYNYEDICPDCKVIESLFGGKVTTRTKREWQKDDQSLEWEISTYPIFDENNQVIQAILFEQDVTEKRRLEASLAQSEKLAAVGQLAAGLAHEINNPLTAIIANTQLLQRELKEDTDKLEMIDLIAKAGQRAAQVVRNLLDLARKEEYLFEPTDVNQTLNRAISLMQHELVSRHITLIYEPSENLPQIMASQDRLQGVWVNLLANAIDSFDESEQRMIRITTSANSSEVRVVVSDTGKGIPPEKLNRIFEPFYTTKAPGKGTGLGLSLVHRIIKQHGGNIHVDSQVGVGTIFTISLPINSLETNS